MGLVVSIFAYLCSVTILVITLALSFGALLYPPDQTTIAPQTIATAEAQRATKPAQVLLAGKGRPGPPGVTGAVKVVNQDIANTDAVRPPHARRVVRQVRAKDWLHQHEPRVFGYVEEPSASFLYNRFQ
jgi:hypothetical protein